MKMNRLKFKLLIFTTFFIIISACTAQKKDDHPGVKLKIKTTAGDILIKLYNETPLHQKNFLKLVNEKYYDGVLFHRVIKDFMIQTGDPDSKTATKGQQLGAGGPDYTIDAEFNPSLIHKKGALSAARTGDQVNPEKKSSGSQFYIVQGKKFQDQELSQLEKQNAITPFVPLIRQYLQKPENASVMQKVEAAQKSSDQAGLDAIIKSIIVQIKAQHPEIKEFKYTQEQKNIYKTIGGTPFLDMNYTVFGEVIEGLDIVDNIANVQTDKSDRPIEDVKVISIVIVK
jgi:cyclophilin family peptidyl-prolyl cis-trans isomerase